MRPLNPNVSGPEPLPVLSTVVTLSPQPAWPLLQQQVWCLGPHSCPHSGAQLPAHRAEFTITYSAPDSPVSIPDFSESHATVVLCAVMEFVEFL